MRGCEWWHGGGVLGHERPLGVVCQIAESPTVVHPFDWSVGFGLPLPATVSVLSRRRHRAIPSTRQHHKAQHQHDRAPVTAAWWLSTGSVNATATLWFNSAADG